MTKKERKEFYEIVVKENIKTMLNNDIAAMNLVISNYEKENEKLKEQLEIVKETLEFYADETNYAHGDVPGHSYILDSDKGHFARKALKQLETTGE